MAAGRLRQLQLLLWKNWLFSLRSWKSTLLQLLAPCFFLLIVTALSFLPQSLKDDLDPKVTPFGAYPKCKEWNGRNCTSVVAMGFNLSQPFAYLDLPSINFSNPADLFLLAGKLQLSKNAQDCVSNVLNETVKITGLDQSDIVNNASIISSVLTLVNLQETKNQTETAIIFFDCHIDTSSPAKSRLNYTIMYNASRAFKLQQLVFGSSNKPDGRAEIQIAIDTAFMRTVHPNLSTLNISVSAGNYPQLFQQQSEESRQAGSATLFLFCAITFQFVMMMYNVVSEKDLQLRQGLKLIGMKDSVYWISWSLTGLVIALLSTIVLIVTGYACQLQFFLNTNVLLSFVIFFVYSASMIPLAFFASVFISTIRMAVNMGMLIFVIGVMVVLILGNVFIITELYANVLPLVYVLSFLPPFHLAKAMADIGIYASTTNLYGQPKNVTFYSFHEFVTPYTTFLINAGEGGGLPTIQPFDLPPTYDAVLLMIADALFYGILFWYLDAIYTSNHGIPRKWYFPILPSYWFGGLCNKDKDAMPQRPRTTTDATPPVDSDGEPYQETVPLFSSNPDDGNTDALEIRELTKIFKFGALCFESSLLPPAVDSLSLSVKQDNILSLLGHNGAGKSTTINMLTGLLEPTSGDAFFYGSSVRKEIDLIRSMLGVCPQHDVLWLDLTAREHMLLYAGMKGVPSDQKTEEVNELLKKVQLLNVANRRVRTYSGGMKRRLSVALAFIGDPQIVFLDEPTTGMDPKIRRNIWNLILKKKEGRVTIMTTHSMEEADILGDTIAIMTTGKLRVMGTSVNLKNRFAGYNIELVVQRDNVQQMKDFVSSQLTGATLRTDPIEVEQGYLLPYNLPPECHRHLVPFFRVLENEPRIARIVLDYSISQTTLEEVFLKVTVEDLFGNQGQQEYRPRLFQSGSFSPTHSDIKNPIA